MTGRTLKPYVERSPGPREASAGWVRGLVPSLVCRQRRRSLRLATDHWQLSPRRELSSKNLASPSPLFGKFQCDPQRVHELDEIDRFGDIPEKSRVQALPDVARHGIRAEGHDRDVLGDRVF